jgi:hypothetical protein
MDQPIRLRVRERVYHIWAAAGGDADKNWLQAETEIVQSMTHQGAPAPKPNRKLVGRGIENLAPL